MSRRGFGETTFDNYVTFMIDGEKNFRLKYRISMKQEIQYIQLIMIWIQIYG